MVGDIGIEPMTFSTSKRRSTTELIAHKNYVNGITGAAAAATSSFGNGFDFTASKKNKVQAIFVKTFKVALINSNAKTKITEAALIIPLYKNNGKETDNDFIRINKP